MYAEGDMKLLRLRDGDAPILLESFQEEGNAPLAYRLIELHEFHHF